MGGKETEIIEKQGPPAPSAGESAADLYNARLQYDPLIAELEQSLAQRYQPQQAQLQADLYGQYAPQMAEFQQGLQEQYAPRQQALQQQLYPKQTQLIEALAGQALQRLSSPYGETGAEAEALGAQRDIQRQRTTRGARESAELGGRLFSGGRRREEREALGGLERGFGIEDIGRRERGAQQALQYATPIAQILYPQISTPGGPQQQAPVQQGVTPGGDQLYNALYGASRPEYFVDQGAPSPLWDIGGKAIGAAGSVAAAAAI